MSTAGQGEETHKQQPFGHTFLVSKEICIMGSLFSLKNAQYQQHESPDTVPGSCSETSSFLDTEWGLCYASQPHGIIPLPVPIIERPALERKGNSAGLGLEYIHKVKCGSD